MKKNEGLFINGNFFPLMELKNISLQNILEMFLKNEIKKRFAVAVNEKLGPKEMWKNKKIFHNDKIEIVYPFKGG